ncbi:MAG: ribosome maturation factor RimP [Deltaproteobacteria bacterium]|nr:ribosome maturation factor RimP [Deltaproteobacteria bacterium]
MKTEEIIAQIARLAAPALATDRLELVDVEVQPRKKTLVRLVVDRPGGVGIEDCARLSRQMGDILDVHDLIESGYVLEVSSPGLDRPLKKPADFAWAVGRPVRLTSRRPVEGGNVLRGILRGFEEDVLTLEAETGVFSLALDEVAKAKLDIDPFGQEKVKQ